MAGLPSPIPDLLVDRIAERFRLLGEPMRIRILDLLREADGSLAVGEIAYSLGSSQQNISKHLGDLAGAGVLERRKVGNKVMYSIREESGVLELCELVCGGLSADLIELETALAPNDRKADR